MALMMKHRSAVRSLLALSSLLFAPLVTSCVSADDGADDDIDQADGLAETTELASSEGGGGDQTSAAACTVSGTNIGRSMVVTTPAILAKFSFARVMNQLRSTAGVSAVQTNTSLFQTWMKTFGSTSAAGDCNDPNIDPNHYGLVCPRTSELKLSTVDPFVATSKVAWRPVGLFNRFDLAPSNGANCGEYRIVYGMDSSNPNVSGRAFIIFEAALPNPSPAAGKAGCLPVARFWQGLTADASDTSRAAKLEKFYFTGGAVTGFPAVVNARHYGLANGATAPFTAGQIRTNFFIDFTEWHLREFKLHKVCTDPATPSTCRLRFDHVTVKTNPAEELFAGTHARSAAFRTAFVNSVASLTSSNVSKIGMPIADVFNEFESISQARNVEYSAFANTTIRGALKTKLTALHSTLTPTNILDRATTQTCAGCHQVSNDAPLGGGVKWPSSLGFVQIDETSALSPALTTKFLPARKSVLEQFINASCAPAPLTDPSEDDDGLTIGGSVVGAAN